MTTKVLVVDDSRFYRNRLCEILKSDPEIEVIATAENGREAVEKALALKPDVITMDIEMPIMDGITAVKHIMRERPTPILMFSSLTSEGAQATLDALDAGALDFLPKRLEEIAGDRRAITAELSKKIKAIVGRQLRHHRPIEQVVVKPVKKTMVASGEPGAHGVTTQDLSKSTGKYNLVVIGSSTGGPSALQTILTALPPDYSRSILVVQHMPAAFTGPFAKRLDALCNVTVKEAEDGDVILPGRVLIAPGGKQMLMAERSGNRMMVHIRDSEPGEQYKPCVDTLFKSVSKNYGGDVLAVVLTGMGSDGRNGASDLKKHGCAVWAQDEQTCVVYGMPHAVVEAGLADKVLPISDIAKHLAQGN